MSIYRMQCAWQLDTAFPADQIVITPHFEAVAPFENVQSLVNDLADALVLWDQANTQLRVKAYDAQALAPNYPIAEAVRLEGTIAAVPVNREVALCLSYYSERNIPRQRGRIYVPCGIAGISVGGARPDGPAQQRVADLVPIFTNLGGIDIDWVVYSRIDNDARPVSHWWVDNAWDTQRRRGLKATSRLTGTVSE